MESADLPDDIARVLDRIDSVPHLEALLQINESAPRGLTDAEIATRIYVTTGAALQILQDLQRRGFVIPVPGSGAYQLDPTDGNPEMVARLAETYRKNVYHLASLIHSRASRAVREFAKAFDMKGQK